MNSTTAYSTTAYSTTAYSTTAYSTVNSCDNEDIYVCDNCDKRIAFDNCFILTKNTNKLYWCQSCFVRYWKQMKVNLWKCET